MDDVCPHPGTVESEQYLWKMKGTCLELTHNYGTEEDADFKVSSGNVEPNRGFGHIALMTSDVYKGNLHIHIIIQYDRWVTTGSRS